MSTISMIKLPFKIYTIWQSDTFLSSMSVFAFLPVIFYKNIFVLLDQVVFYKKVLSYFIKLYSNVSTLKYAFKNVFHF